MPTSIGLRTRAPGPWPSAAFISCLVLIAVGSGLLKTLSFRWAIELPES